MADVLRWVTTWLDLVTVKSILIGVTLGSVHWVEVHDLAVVEGNQCLEQDACVIAGHPLVGDACYWLGWSPERGSDVEHSVRLAESTEADKSKDASDRRHLQWRRQPDPMELIEFCYSSGGLTPTFNAQRQNWRYPALHGPQGTLCCCSEWVPLRCRSSRVQPYPVFVVGMLLVVRNDQPGAEVHEVLHALLAAWGQFAQSAPTPDCVHCFNGSLAHNDTIKKGGESHTVSSYQDPRFHTNNRPMGCVTYNYLLYSGVLLLLFSFLGHACTLYTSTISIRVCPLIPDCWGADSFNQSPNIHIIPPLLGERSPGGTIAVKGMKNLIPLYKIPQKNTPRWLLVFWVPIVRSYSW